MQQVFSPPYFPVPIDYHLQMTLSLELALFENYRTASCYFPKNRHILEKRNPLENSKPQLRQQI